MTEFPPGWAETRFAELGDVRLGKMLDKQKNSGVPVRYLRNINVRWFGFNLSDLQTILLSVDERRALSIEDGDLLICEGGEPGRAAVWRGGPNNLTFQKALHRLRPRTGVVPELLMYRLRADAESGRLAEAFTGTTIKHLTGESLARYRISIPPTGEQHRLVQKISNILGRADACRLKLDRAHQNLKRFRETVLEAAISGRLTREWRNGHENAGEWVSTDIRSIARVGTGSTPSRSHSNFYSASGTPWITSAATSRPVVYQAQEFVTEAAIKAHRLRVFPIGTLLVAMYGEGKTRGQVTELGMQATINQACAAVIVDSSIARKEFVKLVLQANYMQMRALAEGGNQPNLNLSKIKQFPLSLPPMAEQEEIVGRVEELFALADSLQRRHEHALSQVIELTPSVLAKAFRGELVPQDPNDEPAARMLEQWKDSSRKLTQRAPQALAEKAARRVRTRSIQRSRRRTVALQ